MSFSDMATVSASTKRAAIVSGKRGTPSVNVAALDCLPLDPVSPELRQTMELETPHELLQTFVEGDYDIKEGDLLVVDAVEYPIKSCAEWTWRDTTQFHLILEDLRR